MTNASEALSCRCTYQGVEHARLNRAAAIASRRVAQAAPLAPRTLPAVAPQQAPVMLLRRSFGAVTEHQGAAPPARPFPGASRSKPEMPYIEEPSMTYMACLYAVPMAFSFWFLTKFV
eukprot:TRINITY_DN17260_c1_g1_i2.p2 TRINITY_DN17260_c1_g1~~TRINITY_DN17260_c1_g1_i2.p2  ORF type:complete len:118 (+),score=27.39 TRINITY_DN17260_c1_g1_i2:263-616(+)